MKRGEIVAEKQPEQVYAITSAVTGLSYDQKSRKRRYLFSMSLRTICFVGAIFAQGNLRWVLIFGAIFLPYIAVVIANAGRESFFTSQAQSPTRSIEKN